MSWNPELVNDSLFDSVTDLSRDQPHTTHERKARERKKNAGQDEKKTSDHQEQDHVTQVETRFGGSSANFEARPEARVSLIHQTARKFLETFGQSLESVTFQVNDDRREYWVEAHINDKSVRMFPDNGSDVNLVSADYVRLEKLHVESKITDIIQLPDGRLVETLGTVDLSFSFASESRSFTATFTILPRCVHDLILCGPFLRQTQTLTTFKHRIQQSLLPAQAPIRVCLHGTPQEGVVGSINGRFVFACPDTGSEVNVIRRDTAIALGLKISVDPETTLLEFVDGSIIGVCDIVRRARWRFGLAFEGAESVDTNTQEDALKSSTPQWKPGSEVHEKTTFICDFHVVENLSVPIILSSNLLYDTGAFTACAKYFQQHSRLGTSTQQSRPSVAVVKKVSKEISTVKALKTGFHKLFSPTSNGTAQQGASSSIYCSETEERRIAQEDDRIAGLPLVEQQAARQAETIRQQHWRDARLMQSQSSSSNAGSSSS